MKNLAVQRHLILRSLRDFFHAQDFIEIQTPLLTVNPGLEPYITYFETEYVPSMIAGKKQTFYLPTSPEYHLKKALASTQLPRIFEITKSFRNGELSDEHRPEFLMLEWYRHPGLYTEIAQDLEKIFALLGEVFAPTEVLKDKWKSPKHISVAEAFKKYAQVDLFELMKTPDTFEDSFFHIMVSQIEPKLGFEGPEFIWDYPASQCSMAQIKKTDSRLCERFEVYWRGIELANCFGELTHSEEQRKRCKKDQEHRLSLYGKTPPLDEEFLSALNEIKQPAAGIALGVDRLIQCLLDKKTLGDALLFKSLY